MVQDNRTVSELRDKTGSVPVDLVAQRPWVQSMLDMQDRAVSRNFGWMKVWCVVLSLANLGLTWAIIWMITKIR